MAEENGLIRFLLWNWDEGCRVIIFIFGIILAARCLRRCPAAGRLILVGSIIGLVSQFIFLGLSEYIFYLQTRGDFVRFGSLEFHVFHGGAELIYLAAMICLVLGVLIDRKNIYR